MSIEERRIIGDRAIRETHDHDHAPPDWVREYLNYLDTHVEQPRDGLTFPNLNTAKDHAHAHKQMIYVELFGQVGVFQVYPGGRAIQWPATERFWRKLTPGSQFKNNAQKTRIDR